MKSKFRGRRRFLEQGAAMAGLALGALPSAKGQDRASGAPNPQSQEARAYGERSRFDKLSRWPIQPKDSAHSGPPSLTFAPSRTPLQDLKGIITPNPLHYFVDASAPYPLPDIDPAQHRMVIHGLVARPMIFTMDELKRLPSVSRIHWLECSGNGGMLERNFLEFHETAQMQHGATSCAEWTGVPL